MPTLRWPEYAGYATAPVGSAVAGLCRLRRGRFMPVGGTRHDVYTQAKQRNPARWSGNTRDWMYIGVVTLIPERDAVVTAAVRAQHTH